jgi:CRP-like cAMP-binding protein
LPDQETVKNALLRAMTAADYQILRSSMVRVELVRSQELVHPGTPIEFCWFPEDGITSLIAMSDEGHETEVGVVGRNGMVDVATILGMSCATARAFIQIPGYAYRLPAAILVGQMQESLHLRALLHRYAYDCLTQISDTALANASFTIVERLARWLLLCANFLGRDEVLLTHDFLSVMLNVRRAGVTEALRVLDRAGMIETRRGAIQIIDREGLSRTAHRRHTPLAHLMGLRNRNPPAAWGAPTP